jgi:hypothetical protein
MVWDKLTMATLRFFEKHNIRQEIADNGLETLYAGKFVAQELAEGGYELSYVHNVSDAEASSEPREILEFWLKVDTRRTAMRFVLGKVVKP